MKFLSIFALMFAFQLFAEEPVQDLAKTEEVFESAVEGVSSSAAAVSETEELEVSEPEALTKFLVEEVFSAFGGFQDILFSKPSFDIHWTPEGMQIKSCSFKVQLRQLRAVKYNLADMKLYGFRSDAEIGGPRWLMAGISCGGAVDLKNKRFKVKFFVTDEELNPSHYSLKIKTMDKEQLNIKLGSIEIDIDIETVDDVLLSDPYGRVEILPKDSPFLRFFEKEKSSVEGAEPVLQNAYDIPSSLWGQIQEGDLQSIKGEAPDRKNIEEDFISLKKMNVNQQIFLEGFAEILLPVYQEGVREDTPVTIPVKGRIFSSAEGEFLPVIDISLK